MAGRGAKVMGFDQERTVHRFLLYADGGATSASRMRKTRAMSSSLAARAHLLEGLGERAAIERARGLRHRAYAIDGNWTPGS